MSFVITFGNLRAVEGQLINSFPAHNPRVTEAMPTTGTATTAASTVDDEIAIVTAIAACYVELDLAPDGVGASRHYIPAGQTRCFALPVPGIAGIKAAFSAT